MSYEPTNWKTGDVVTSAKLNKIEGGVSEVSEAYEPTVWQTGDVVTSAKLNKIEQALADATAESGVTVFDGSVTTEQSGTAPAPIVALALPNTLTANIIRVTFNGQVYECARQTGEFDYYGTDFTAATVDWSTYPFSVATEEDVWFLFTETVGTYTLKIEVPEGTSSLLIANLTIENENSIACTILAPFQDGEIYTPILTGNVATSTRKILLGPNSTSIYAFPTLGANGNVTSQGNEIINGEVYARYEVTGNCTIIIGSQH